MTEYKEFTPTIRGVTGDGRVTIVMATLNEVDHDGDVTLPGFFGRQVAQVVPSHDWSHVPLGKAVIRESGSEALADLAFNLKVPAAVDWYEAIRYDYEHPPALQQYSYGYAVLPGGARMGEFKGERVRFLQPVAGGPGADVHEVSPVLLGAGVGTRTVAVKHDRRPRRAVEAGVDRAELERIQLRLIRDSLQAQQRTDLQKAQRAVAIAYSEDQPWVALSEARAAATAAVQTYSPLLGLDGVKVRWFSEEHDEEFADFHSVRPLWGTCWPLADRKSIWLHSELSAPDAWTTAAHELRHLAGGDEDQATVYDVKAKMDWSSR